MRRLLLFLLLVLPPFSVCILGYQSKSENVGRHKASRYHGKNNDIGLQVNVLEESLNRVPASVPALSVIELVNTVS